MSHLKTVLMVAEKPNLAMTLSNLLGGTAVQKHSVNKRSDNSIPLFEWNGTWPVTGEIVHFKMTSTFGHVYGVKFEQQYQDWKTNPEELFMCAIEKEECNPESRVVQQLASAGRGVDYLVLWLDCDKEGENICFEVINIIAPVMNKGVGEKVFRAKFSALTKQDVMDSFYNFTRPNTNEALSVDARRELDLRIGVAFTRFQTTFFKRKYGREALKTDTMPYGPCQTPTLAFCVERHMKVQTFSGDTFYRVCGSVDLPGRGFVPLKWTKDRTFNRQEAEDVLEKLRANNCIKVASMRTAEKRKLRPLALNTVQMLKIASNRLRISPSETMELAEQLYMKGFISYPRTETTQYPASFDRMTTLSRIAGSVEFGKFAEQLMYNISDSLRRGTDAGDHPPIIPLKTLDPTMFKYRPNVYRLFQLICSYFLAGLSSDCTYSEKTITFELDAERFQLEGIEILDPGYTEILNYQRPTAVHIPDIPLGTTIRLGACRIEEGATKPPEHLTESDLIDLMEKHGIGTDASIPAHIENIFKRNFAELNSDRRIVPTPMGIALINAYNALDADLAKPQIRSTLEKDLILIAEGKVTKEEIVNHVISIYKTKYQYLVNNIAVMDDAVAKVLHLTATRNFVMKPNFGQYLSGFVSGQGRSRVGLLQQRSQTQCGKRTIGEISRKTERSPGVTKRRRCDMEEKQQRQPEISSAITVPTAATGDIVSRLFALAGTPTSSTIGAHIKSTPVWSPSQSDAMPVTPICHQHHTSAACHALINPESRMNPHEFHKGRLSANEHGTVISHGCQYNSTNATVLRPHSIQKQCSPNVLPILNPLFSECKVPVGRNMVIKQEFDELSTTSCSVKVTSGTYVTSNKFNQQGSSACESPTTSRFAMSSVSVAPEKFPDSQIPVVYDFRDLFRQRKQQNKNVGSSNGLYGFCGQSQEAYIKSEFEGRTMVVEPRTQLTFHVDQNVSKSGDSSSSARHPRTQIDDGSQRFSTEKSRESVQIVTPAISTHLITDYSSPLALTETRRPALDVTIIKSVPNVDITSFPSPIQNRDLGWSNLYAQKRPVAAVAGKVQSTVSLSNHSPPLVHLSAPGKPSSLPCSSDDWLSISTVKREPFFAGADSVTPLALINPSPMVFGVNSISNLKPVSSVDYKPAVLTSSSVPAVHYSTATASTLNFAHPRGFTITGKDFVAATYEFCVKSLIGSPDFTISGSGTNFSAVLKVSGILYGPCEATNKKLAKKAVAKVFLKANGFANL